MRLTADLLQTLAVLAPGEDAEGGEADPEPTGEPEAEPTGEAAAEPAGGEGTGDEGGDAASLTLPKAEFDKRLARAERSGGKAAMAALARDTGLTVEELKQLAADKRQREEDAKSAEQRLTEQLTAEQAARAAAEADALKARREARFGAAATGKIRPEALANGLAFSVAEFPADGADDYEAVVAAVLEQHPYLAPPEPTPPNPPSPRGSTGRTPPVKAARSAQVDAILTRMGYRPTA